MPDLDDITGDIIDAAIYIHRKVGPGLLESVYETLLDAELTRRGHSIVRQKHVAFEYDGIHFERGLRLDLLVDNQVVVEVKSLERLAAVHRKQVITYLRLLNLPVGLLLNFGAPALREGMHRIVNHLIPTPASRLRVNQPADPPAA